MEDIREIFLDKINLSANILAQNAYVIDLVNSVRDLVRNGNIDEDRINEHSEFRNSWKELFKLYDFINKELIEKLSDNKKKIIEKLYDKYTKTKQPMTYKELNEAFDILGELTYLGGFHSVTRRLDDEDDF